MNTSRIWRASPTLRLPISCLSQASVFSCASLFCWKLQYFKPRHLWLCDKWTPVTKQQNMMNNTSRGSSLKNSFSTQFLKVLFTWLCSPVKMTFWKKRCCMLLMHIAKWWPKSQSLCKSNIVRMHLVHMLSPLILLFHFIPMRCCMQRRQYFEESQWNIDLILKVQPSLPLLTIK